MTLFELLPAFYAMAGFGAGYGRHSAVSGLLVGAPIGLAIGTVLITCIAVRVLWGQ